MNDKLKSLFKARFGGAVNIRGIRYQLLYSLRRAFDLYDETDDPELSVTLEGIEDVDVNLRRGEEYVQVKTAHRPQNWSFLKSPIANFLQTLRSFPQTVLTTDAQRFVLVVDFILVPDIRRLADRLSLPQRERLGVERKFFKLCKELGALPEESRKLLERLEIVSLTEEQVWEELRPILGRSYRLGTEAIDTYALALMGRFLGWAKERKTITRRDLDAVRVEVGEALARELEFQAYGRSLLIHIDWHHSDGAPDDFFDKATRPGHIVAGLDVRRPFWQDCIERAVRTTGICVIRASSGQGKSTLLYRCAYDGELREHTLSLRVAETPEDAEQIRSYLRARARLARPTLLLIDDAGWQVRQWPLVVEECAALRIPVLIGSRQEDWFRFGREGMFNFEVIEPELNLEEARNIFAVFRAQGRIHSSVISAEWAFERAGEPHLLIEYIFLITQGRMLDDRLRDQVNRIEHLSEGPAKLELLRRASLVHALGGVVDLPRLMKELDFDRDPQRTLLSTSGEYLTVGDLSLNGLHRVRSEHLVHILHEGYPSLATTALDALKFIPLEHISTFVANALDFPQLNATDFISGLVESARENEITRGLAFLDGIFKYGERAFFRINIDSFDQAYSDFGPRGPWLIKFHSEIGRAH